MSTPSRVLSELIQQHATLRTMMEHCEQLADELEASRGDPAELTREVAKLRIAFEAHNAFEEKLLRPVLVEMDAFGEVRVDRMVADHLGEHRAVQDQLSGPLGELRDALDQLRVHLDAEERYFLSSRVLRDDTITVETSS